jgi:tetratricopeptide (TPR) repeat protein
MFARTKQHGHRSLTLLLTLAGVLITCSGVLAQRNDKLPKGNPSPFAPGGGPPPKGAGPGGRFSPQVPPGAVQGGGYQEHEHSDTPTYANSRKTPLAQQQLADAILQDVLDRVWAQADKHFHEGEYSHAVNLNRVIMEGEPFRVETYENSAFLLWSTDRNEEAIAVLKQGIKANPKNYYMYDELGRHYSVNLKQHAKAIPYFEKAVQFKAPFFTWNNLARCYEKTNQWEKAVKTWEAATKFTSPVGGATRNVPAENGLARARAELAKRRNR